MSVAKLLSNKKEFESGLLIEKDMQQAKIELQEKFWKKVREEFEKKLLISEVYGGSSIKSSVKKYYKGSRNNKNFGLKFLFTDYSGLNVFIYINLFEVIHYGIRLEDDKGNIISDLAKKDALRADLGFGNAVADDHKDWVVCYKQDDTSGQKAINFKTFNEAAISLVEDVELENAVNNIVVHIYDLISKITI